MRPTGRDENKTEIAGKKVRSGIRPQEAKKYPHFT
jgi:hypothetical protein